VSITATEQILHAVPLALLGLFVGCILNVVVYRLPRMLERQWWQDAAAQLADSDSHARTLGLAPSPALAQGAGALQQALDALPALSLSRPGSHCPHCGTPIAWHDNLPLLGWLKRRGRCAACAAPISPRYPLVEAGTALLFAAVGAHFQGQAVALLWCAVTAVLLAAALIDWDTTLLPDGKRGACTLLAETAQVRYRRRGAAGGTAPASPGRLRFPPSRCAG
jgi:leader peptidase (prepilin peptidase)/N-methyltransferase